MINPSADLPPDEPMPTFDFPQLVEDARRVHLGAGLLVVAWVHLVIFACCEALFLTGDRAATHFLPLWLGDVAFGLLYLRPKLVGLGRLDSARSARLTLRIWLTFCHPLPDLGVAQFAHRVPD